MSEIRDRDELILTVNRLMICAMEDIDSGRNEASPTTLDLVQRIEDTDAALRSALETATRELETYRVEHEGCIDIWRTTIAASESRIRELERERDEARGAMSAERAIVASLCTHAGQLESERDRLRSRVEELEEDLIDIPDVAK